MFNGVLDLNSRPIARILDGVAELVKGITADTRDKLASLIATGIDNGESPAQIAQAMLDSVEGWAGLEDLTKSRAMVIARTETAHAYNWASAAAYRDGGVVDTVICLDSPDCGWDGHDDTEAADGTSRTIDEMEQYPTSHPNCVRAFAPDVLGEGTDPNASDQTTIDETDVSE